MNERLYYLDVLRLIAIVSVIVMHSTGAVQRFYSNGTDTVFFLTNIPNACTRFAVPLFVMISGRLMINRGHDYRFLIRKSIHYMAVFFSWSLLYSIVLIELPLAHTYSVKAFIFNSIVDSASGYFHFWFIFLICGLYLIVPIIEILINNLSKELWHYYAVINIVFCFCGKTLLNISLLKDVLGDHLDSFLVGFLNIYTFYFILGYWLRDYSPKRKRLLWIGLIGGVALNAVVGCFSSALAGDRVVSFIDAQAPSTLIVTICIFLLGMDIRVSENKKDTIRILSELSFGAYLCHMLIIELIKRLFPIIRNPLLACTLTIAATLLLGFGVSFLLWKNKLTRRLVK